jgi:ubiquinone/menaquinone biosynthesis C-methylase UbiE
VRYDRVDLAREQPFPDSSFDLVISNAVLEHVDRPLRMLESISRLLSPTGEAWLKFDLHRGPKASHRYREVFFPLAPPAVRASSLRSVLSQAQWPTVSFHMG